MKPTALTILLIFSISFLSAQVANLINISDKDWSNILTSGQPLVIQNARKVKGTPFLFEEYLPGAVYLNDSLHSPENFQFKLNLLSNEIWIKKDDGTELILTNPRLVGLVLMKNGVRHIFKRLALPSANSTIRKFAQMFYCGSITLIKETQKKFVSIVESGSAVLNGEEQDAYETKQIYYLADEKGIIQKLRLKQLDVYELYPTIAKKNKEALDLFCSSKNIGKSLTEQQIVELLAYMSTLKT